MVDTVSKHNAAPSAAGYFFQGRWALVEALRHVRKESDTEIAIERFDDVSIEKDGDPIKFFQTKHHITKHGNLSDNSVDLWKTLYIWANRVKSEPTLLRHTRFALLTTASAPKDSAAAMLRAIEVGEKERNPRRAHEQLVEVANSIKYTSSPKEKAGFLELSPEIRQNLIDSIIIFDQAPKLADLGDIIEDRLLLICSRDKVQLACELLEGWWWHHLFRALTANPVKTISVLDVEDKIDNIREELKRDALPLDRTYVAPSAEKLATLDETLFVKQLLCVGIGEEQINFAKEDFTRAYHQRSKWVREKLLYNEELGEYEERLIEEWRPRFARMCRKLSLEVDSAIVEKSGEELYSWVENDARFPIRTRDERFLTVGSFHILADELRVGWHRDYKMIHTNEEEESKNV